MKLKFSADGKKIVCKCGFESNSIWDFYRHRVGEIYLGL